MARARFITFEGGEGVGKSTQVRRVEERLRALGYGVTTTREPGGSPGAEALRALLVTGDTERWSPLAETLILNAAREDHLARTIRPALARGEIVLCDRFADSTRAYQGAAGGLAAEFILRLEDQVLGETRPDLTLVLDAPPQLGLGRAGARGGAEARFEAKALAFHERLREGFLKIAAAEPKRCVVISASLSEDAVFEAIWAALAPRLEAAGDAPLASEPH